MTVEQNVEFYVRQFYEKYKDDISMFPQGQMTERQDIQSALSVSSKRGTGQRGAPDFIGTFDNDDRTVLVVECKADADKHISRQLRSLGIYVSNQEVKKDGKVKEFACDGVLHYAKHLSPHYNVIALGVSGIGNGKIISADYYYQLKGSQSFVRVDTKGDELLTPANVLREVKSQKRVVRYRAGELIKTAQSSYLILSELGVSPADRAFFIGMLLIALDDQQFNDLLDRESNFSYLLSQIGHCVCDRFDHTHSAIMRKKIDSFCAEMEKSIGNNAHRSKNLIDLARNIKRHKDGAGADTESDELGAFFTSFLTKSSNSKHDQQELGIVLTPHHITEIFPMVASVGNTKDKIFADSCCGTGGFLIAALKALESGANHKSSRYINNNLWGVEQDPKMYYLACLNMILKGGDASNIILGDSFADETRAKIQNKPNIAFLNPPYTMRKKDGTLNYDRHELQFVNNACRLVKKGGKVVALMPAKSVAASDGRVIGIKDNLIRQNTVEGIFKLSKTTFEGVVNVETIIMICTAGVPHDSNHKVYFGNWEDDGMLFVRKIGAVDKYGTHDYKISRYIKNFHDRNAVKGESIMATISADEEWLYQVKLINDVENELWQNYPNQINIARHILNYCALQIRLGDIESLSTALKECARCKKTERPDYWKTFSFDDIFELTKGKRFSENQTNIEFKEYPESGYIPYVSSSDIEEKQGLNGYIKISVAGKPTHDGNYMILNYGGGQLNCFYREGRSYCTDSLNVAKLKDGTKMNIYIAAYLKEVISQYKPCFSYNLAASLSRLRPLKIPLPITKDNNINWDYLSYYGMLSFHEKFGNINKP